MVYFWFFFLRVSCFEDSSERLFVVQTQLTFINLRALWFKSKTFVTWGYDCLCVIGRQSLYNCGIRRARNLHSLFHCILLSSVTMIFIPLKSSNRQPLLFEKKRRELVTVQSCEQPSGEKRCKRSGFLGQALTTVFPQKWYLPIEANFGCCWFSYWWYSELQPWESVEDSVFDFESFLWTYNWNSFGVFFFSTTN